jgi:hypothetical protein
MRASIAISKRILIFKGTVSRDCWAFVGIDLGLNKGDVWLGWSRKWLFLLSVIRKWP